MHDYADVVSQAMRLPDEKRAELAHHLLVSLQHQAEHPGETLEDIIAARQQRVRSGAYTAYEASETLNRMKRSLDDRSQS